MPRLNENVLSFDSSRSVGELLKDLRSSHPSYVVLRVKRDMTDPIEFFVFHTEFLKNSVLAGISMMKRRQPLLSIMPQLISEAAAPQLKPGNVIEHWNDAYDDGPWPCAFYPVSTAYEHAIGVWETDQFDAMLPSEPGPTPEFDPELEPEFGATLETVSEQEFVEDIDLEEPVIDAAPDIEETQTAEEIIAEFERKNGTANWQETPMHHSIKTPAASRVSSFKKVVGGLFGSDKNAAQSDLLDLDFLEESIEEAAEATYPDVESNEHLPAQIPEQLPVAVPESLQHQTLYPNIDASNAHPVVEETIDLTVTLGTEASDGMTGQVNMPDTSEEDYRYRLQVHLLCGDASLWDTLEYSQTEGVVKAAKFQLTLPDMPLDLSGNYPEHYKLPVRVNFYYQSRWCGEGERYLDLRLDELVSPLRRIPPPPQSEWRQLIKLDPMSEPPDLLVRIAHKPGSLSYHWSCMSPHLAFNESMNAEMTLNANAQQFVNNLFEPFAKVSLDAQKAITLKGICEEIYDCTPMVFKQAFWELSEAAERGEFEFNSILFISDEPHIPWELMRVTDPQRQQGAEILSITHSVGRWLSSHSNHLPQQIHIEQLAAAGSDYADERMIPDLPHVNEELALLTQRYQAEAVPLHSDAVIGFLQNGRAQALHVACHGRMSPRTPYKSQLLMEDHPQAITPPQISTYEVETGLGAQHPMIFLNACQAGATAERLDWVSGFPAAFLKAGASAVICPLWTVSDEHAKRVAAIFYEAIFEQPGITLGEILQRIHQQWESEKQLSYLAYTLYGDPQAQVTHENLPT